MKLSEIKNKHGQPIYYFSKNNGNTELEKYRNSFIFDKNNKEYIIQGVSENYTCFVQYNNTEHSENCGYYMMIFNGLGELIEYTFPHFELSDDSKLSVEESLKCLGIL